MLVSTPLENAFFDGLAEALARHVGREAAGFVRMVFSLHDPATIERLFREAGFDDVTVRTYTKPLRLPAARDFLWHYVQCTPLMGMLASLDAAGVAALESEVVHRWEPWSNDGGMTYEQGMNVAKAWK